MSRELTREEKAVIRKLVTKWCANYDKEYGCLLGLGFPRKQCLRGKRRNSEMSELSPTAEVRDMELVTTSECYMLGKCRTGAFCRYFREAVLPLDPMLEATLTQDGPAPETRICPVCGRVFLPDGRTRYCSPVCSKAARLKKQRGYMRKYRG